MPAWSSSVAVRVRMDELSSHSGKDTEEGGYVRETMMVSKMGSAGNKYECQSVWY